MAARAANVKTSLDRIKTINCFIDLDLPRDIEDYQQSCNTLLSPIARLPQKLKIESITRKVDHIQRLLLLQIMCQSSFLLNRKTNQSITKGHYLCRI